MNIKSLGLYMVASFLPICFVNHIISLYFVSGMSEEQATTVKIIAGIIVLIVCVFLLPIAYDWLEEKCQARVFEKRRQKILKYSYDELIKKHVVIFDNGTDVKLYRIIECYNIEEEYLVIRAIMDHYDSGAFMCNGGRHDMPTVGIHEGENVIQVLASYLGSEKVCIATHIGLLNANYNSEKQHKIEEMVINKKPTQKVADQLIKYKENYDSNNTSLCHYRIYDKDKKYTQEIKEKLSAAIEHEVYFEEVQDEIPCLIIKWTDKPYDDIKDLISFPEITLKKQE